MIVLVMVIVEKVIPVVPNLAPLYVSKPKERTQLDKADWTGPRLS